MNEHSGNTLNASKASFVSKTSTDTETDISLNLSWMAMLRGVAIIGVFLDNWTGYMRFTTTPALLYSLARTVSLAVGPFVQVFFILSGFGLTIAYYKQSKDWNWGRWIWRRITKIVIPYEIAVVLSFILARIGSYLHPAITMQFSLPSFLANALFLRNFYSPSWGWNPPFWFMPVIIGLYLCFPVLLRTLTKSGPWVLLAISVLLSYGTLSIAFFTGIYQGHGSDVFTFWLLQFALGMVLAHIRETEPHKLRLLVGLKAFSFGIGLVVFSWWLRTCVPSGAVFNDSVTSIGIFLVLLNLVWVSWIKVPIVGEGLVLLGNQSYFMYLIHYPIIKFLIGPPLRSPTNPIIVIALGCIYIAVIFLLSRVYSQPVSKFTNWLYCKCETVSCL
jgi:peptidoglycan/LPS O-acetylase OafA/YrhL